ncbi:MAG: NAD-dependent malic enzyme [Candidatus Kapabacteria bacterium]|nr:NAD-dependent malic enzyme [Candidatus Kapabacteria bacterium]
MTIRPRFPDQDYIFLVKSPHRPGSLGFLLSVLGAEGALVGDIKTLFIGKESSFREITVSVFDNEHLEKIKRALLERTKVEIVEIRDIVFERHKGGKIRTSRVKNLDKPEDLRYIYTPGVARVCKKIQEEPETALIYTNISNSVGIFTNGTRVLGLGDIGPRAAMPVMEGKSVLYDQFVGISATPILINTKDPIEFVDIVEKIAPTFGGIHLEDIRTPDCFYIESELIRRLGQPVMHDDQHGTATVLLAAVISALRSTGQEENSRLIFGQLGLGAAGFGIAKLLIDYGFSVIGFDPSEDARKRLIEYGGKEGTIDFIMEQANVIIATTGVVGLITKSMVKKGQIILSLSNPVPEILPDDALDAGAAYAADGQSVNNALAFPGLFKAALSVKAKEISSQMKIAAAQAIADLARPGELVPSIFHSKVHDKVIEKVMGLF